MAEKTDPQVTTLKAADDHLEFGATAHQDPIDDASSGELITVEKGFSSGEVIVELSPAEEKKILRKIDYRLVPILGFLYLIAFVDRSNIGNAKIAGLEDKFNLLSGLRYNTAVTMFFISYALFEVPSNIVLKMWKPRIWISILLFTWGVVMTLMGTVGSFGGLLAARFCLGIAESGFFPAATYLLTLWYKRFEIQGRMAVFYTAASMSGAFSGLLAYAIEKMDGVAGLGGWRWIFILEGLVPIAVSLFIWKILPDEPAKASFLNKHEKEFIINRLALETGSGRGRVTNQEKLKLRHIWAALKEYKIWMMWVVFWANSVGVYGFTATVPTVIENLGYEEAIAQLLTIPIYVFAMMMVIIFAFWSERAKVRSWFIMAGYTIAACGFLAQLAIPQTRLPGLTYGFLFPVAAGLYCPFVMIVTWTANNLAPSGKRAVGMALLISVGNLGGIAGSNIYIASEAPKYPAGFGTGLGLCCSAIIMAFILRQLNIRQNRKRRALLDSEGEESIRARYSEQELLDMGDKSPFFIYVL